MSGRGEGNGGAPPLAGVVLSRVVAAEAARDPGRGMFLFENGARPAERVTVADLAVGGVRVANALLRLGLRGLRCAAVLTTDYRLAAGDLAGVIRRTGVKSLVVSTPEGRAAGHDPST